VKKDGDGKEDIDGGIEKLMSELKEIKGSLKREPEKGAEAVAEEPRRRRLASRSPGVTPKSSVHRSLAKLGMLDSPDTPQAKNWLEEFFEKYMDGKELGMTEGAGEENDGKGAQSDTCRSLSYPTWLGVYGTEQRSARPN